MRAAVDSTLRSTLFSPAAKHADANPWTSARSASTSRAAAASVCLPI